MLHNPVRLHATVGDLLKALKALPASARILGTRELLIDDGNEESEQPISYREDLEAFPAKFEFDCYDHGGEWYRDRKFLRRKCCLAAGHMDLSYKDGILHVRCTSCDATVVRLAVASEPREKADRGKKK